MLKKYSRFLALFFALFLAASPLLTAIPASAAETYTVSGVWVFADEIDYSSCPTQSINFVSNGRSFTGFLCDEMYGCLGYVFDDTFEPVFTSGWFDDGVWRTVDFGASPQSVSYEFYSWFTLFASPQASEDPPVVPPAGDGTSALVAVFGIFSGIGAWLTAIVSSLVGMFYADNKLTFVGYLAVAGLAVGVILLLLFLVSGFLRFRG